jgi:hypothetical protein
MFIPILAIMGNRAAVGRKLVVARCVGSVLCGFSIDGG